MKSPIITKVALGVALLILAACGDSKERIPADAPGYVNGKPVHPTIKIGNPYKVDGENYYPRYEPDYVEEGMASWYGPNFHGKSTANGEKYNQWAMTAAHKTLPMPSMVKVIHKKTGKSIMVRVNDRGPFSHGRIIDLSRAAAEELGVVREGVAEVRVEYMKPETEAYISKLQLEKPREWAELDRDREREERAVAAMPVVDSAPLDKIVISDTPELVQAAADIPELYADTPHAVEESTTQMRGVKIEEIGYADDAFSVLAEKNMASVPADSPFQRASYEAPAQGGTYDPIPLMQPAVASYGSSGSYYVQAGAFSNRENAQKLAGKLNAFSAVDISEIMSGDRALHRVRLGPTKSEDVAEELLVRLQEYGIHDAKIIRE